MTHDNTRCLHCHCCYPSGTDGHGCEDKESLSVAPGYEWDGSWQLDLTNAANNLANDGGGGGSSQGVTDGEGWDYATSKDRFGPGKGAHRIPRDQGSVINGRARLFASSANKGRSDEGEREETLLSIFHVVPNVCLCAMPPAAR